MTDDKSLPDTYVGFSRQHFLDAVAHTAQRLRSLADDIEREAAGVNQPLTLEVYKSTGAIAGRVVHSLAWGFANANVDDIVTAAAEADRALAAQAAENGTAR